MLSQRINTCKILIKNNFYEKAVSRILPGDKLEWGVISKSAEDVMKNYDKYSNIILG